MQFTFGQLEGRLARIHAIADPKRTAFQARLKNFQRLGFPPELRTSKGKTALYSPSLMTDMALAVQLTELGLAPDRVVTILRNSILPLAVGMEQGSRLLRHSVSTAPEGQLVNTPLTDALTTYLTLDPAALWPLTDHGFHAFETWDVARLTLFCLRGTAVQRHLAALTTFSGRLSLVNVTAVIAQLAEPPENLSLTEKRKWADEFLGELIETALKRSKQKSDLAATALVGRFIQMCGATSKEASDPGFATEVAHDMYLPIETVRVGIRQFLRKEVNHDSD